MGSIHESVFFAEGSVAAGDVSIGEQSSVWFNAVLRGDGKGIRIGGRTNVQDGVIIHAGRGFGVDVGDGVTIGHGAIVHGCRVGSHTLIGMGSIVMNGAVIGEHCVVGAGALVTGGTVVPDYGLVLGSPAKAAGRVTEEHLDYIRENAEFYVGLAQQYAAEERRREQA